MKWLVALALVACGKHEIDADKARALFDTIVIDTPPGVSDLALDDHGTLWAMPERDRFVVELALGTNSATATRHVLEGVPDGIDTESLAWLGGNHFAIGTEGAHEPTASVAFADLRDGKFVVTRTRPLTSAELGVELAINKGAEGICGHDDTVLVAIETVGTFADGSRWAPLAWLRDDKVSVTKLHLTTATGKISALSCRFGADGTADVLAIERHYGVVRFLKFSVAPGTAEVTPTVDLDLAPVLHDSLNLEGIVRLPDGRVVAVNDNQGATVSGPTELLVFHPR